MRIGMVLLTEFPPDIRVEKEHMTLNEHHDVFLLCPRRGNQAAAEQWNGLGIRRVFSPGQRWRGQLSLMSRQASALWEAQIERFATDIEADVLHVHDLPLLGPALHVATRLNLPVVADLHENYPALLEVSRGRPWYELPSFGALASRLLVSISRWRDYESRVVPKADRVIVVIEEAAERLVGMGISKERIAVVGNYATFDTESDSDPPSPPSGELNSRLSVVYAGGFGETRDLETVLDAVAILPDAVRAGMHVQLVGGMGRDLTHLERHAARLGVGDYVTLTQWLPRKEAELLMSKADVGLVPHVKSAHTDATVPHKLFQYMWRRLPVVVSNCAPLERIVRDAGCGFVYESGNAQSLAERLGEMHALGDRRASMGAAGREAVLQTYNWSSAGKALLDVYRSIG